MEANGKRLARMMSIIRVMISVVLCIFLVLLSDKLLSNLTLSNNRPVLGDAIAVKGVSDDRPVFQDDVARQALLPLENQVKQLTTEKNTLQNKQENLQATIDAAQKNYANEQASFNNWVKTRDSLGLSKDDSEVRSRAKKLDDYYQVAKSWIDEQKNIETQSLAVDKKLQQLDGQIEVINAAASDRYEKAMNQHELKIFLWRLLFVIPVLLVSVFFVLRRRSSDYWPLYRGFVFFGFYAFFFGLAPYLPSFGGYVRYSVGILLTVALGYYAIVRMKIYMKEREAQLAVSQQERAERIQSASAEKAFAQHFCPSCGKDFLLSAWENKGSDASNYRLVSHYCRHCGLNLFKDCHRCGAAYFVHLPYCQSCGESVKKDSA